MRRVVPALLIALAVSALGTASAYAYSYQQYVETGWQGNCNTGYCVDYKFYFHYSGASAYLGYGDTMGFATNAVLNYMDAGTYCNQTQPNGVGCADMIWWVNWQDSRGTWHYPRFDCYPNGSWDWAQYWP